MKLSKLLKALPNVRSASSGEAIEIMDVTDDSRKVSTGTLFVCVDGHVTDGHDYAEEAVKNGAVAIIAERQLEASVPVVYVRDTRKAVAMLAAKFFSYPTKTLPVIGVTGTNGKTTVTYLLEAIFSEYGMKTGVIGTIQLKIGSQTEPIENTTPNALFLQKTFRRMLLEGVDVVIMEVSSHALDMGRVYGTEFLTTIYTNISQDHLDYHKTMTEYLHAKSLLFSQMGNQYDVNTHKYAILNHDDSSADLMRKSTAQPVMTYGTHTPCDVRAKNIQVEAGGTSFTLETENQSVHIHTRMLGYFNVYNMLAASSAALAHQVPIAYIKKALEGMRGVVGRFEQVEAGQSFSVIVDYAHTPDSLLNVLQTIKQFVKGIRMLWSGVVEIEIGQNGH
ncbi:UDP-N-acetylmuramoyl-L-alanyl-D-glutamate--2,6-diaminopimelate ligase [Lentibacillus sp. JNUCC-1]|nr:UDP-N-acetylmuramoyl-L-alanyl-D-glutamate--2,6-diaminopimelate ligase [Lentibacillus sp. JNUCC-1]